MSANIPNDPVAIQKFFTSRDNNADASTYVGQQQRLWYNPITNSIYVSDGETPGGIPVGGGTGIPGGPTNSIQYNAGSDTFGGSSNLTISGNGMVVVGNVSAAYFIGDGGYLTNVYSNSNVANYLANYAGNVAGNNITISNVANLGNFTISDQTLSGTIDTRDVNIETYQGNADVNILGGFNIHASNLELPPDFSVDTLGRVTILVPTPENISGSVNIIGSSDGSEVAPQNYGVLLHQTGQQSIPSRIYNDSAASYAAYVGRRYNGTSAAPTPVAINQIVSRIASTPYVGDTVTGWPTVSTARIDFITTENQSAANNGSKIQMWATPSGTDVANIGLVADFGLGGINLTGNLLPTIDNIYSLGNINNRWIGAYFGNAGIYIQDTTLGTTGSMSLDTGVMLFDTTIDALQVGNTQLTQSGLSSTDSSQDIVIGIAGDTGTTLIQNAGLKFPSGNIQTDAGIPTSEKGAALGVVPLNALTKIDTIYLPSGGPVYLGTWDALTNTPTLADGTGIAGDLYIVSVAGTQDLGSGSITFAIGDEAVYNGTIWQKVAAGAVGVTSFNTRIGAVILTSGDVTNALSAGSIVNSKLVNSTVTVNTGAGLSGGGVINLGGTVTLTANVNDITAGTGVTVTPSSGNYTIAIGQPVGTANTVQFTALSTTTTIQATGNITGGNLSTANTVSVGGNVIANNVTSNTLVTANNVNATGNINFTGPNVSLGTVANVRITGGTDGQFLTTNGSGVLSWANVSAANITGTVANANYAAYAGNVTIAGQSNITSLGTLTSLGVNGTVTAVAFTANTGVFTGNGSGLTSITGANVTGQVSYAAVANSVAGANVTGAVGLATFATTANAVAGANVTGAVGLATFATTANAVAGANVSGQVANALVAGTVYTNAQPNITSVGTLTSLNSSGVITGTRLVSNIATGTAPFTVTSTTQVANLSVATAGSATTAGTVTTAAQPNITSVGTLSSLAVTGNISGANLTGTHYGAATGLTAIPGANVTGAVGLATFATTANSVAGANVTGQVANALVAGTVYTNAQPNITSVGTLTGLTSGGIVNLTTASNVALGSNANVHITGGTANYALITNGTGALSWSDISGISGSTAQTVTTWVPTLTATGGGTFTYSIQTGYYIKSGRSVSSFFTITITGVTGVSGTVRVSNLPATAINQTNAGGGALDNYSFAVLPSHVTGLVAANNTYMDLYWHDRTGSTNTIQLMTTGLLGTSATLIGRVTYISAT
jgi:hypothetical protein